MMQIRKMQLGDIDSICEIENASFHTPWTRNDFLSELENPLAHYLVVYEGDCLIAYIGSWIIIDECHINNIAVCGERRGQGVGRLLMQELFSTAAQMGVVRYTLEVRPSNEVALALYKSLGFIENGRRKKYYADTGEDAIIMWRAEK